ncbi:alpha/beta hydrolase [Candidatus Woesearchaeota archaeon]|nr:alpha/beta hydrolase [Candidatus Woesearchaeota archaeon]
MKNKTIAAKTRKKVSYIIIVILLISLFILSVLFFLGIRINFLLNDELVIDLKPLDRSILLHYNETAVLNFTIMNKNFMFCKSYCEYKLTDLSKNIIIENTDKIPSRLLKSKETLALSYDLTSTLPGSGQILYSFEARCNNIKSFLCNTDEQPRYKTSFITFNYDLTEQEKLYKQALRELLTNYTKELEKVDVLNQQNNILLFTNLIKPFLKPDEFNNTDALQGKIPEESKELATSSYILDGSLISLNKQASYFIDLWQEEQYTELADEFSAKEIESFKNELELDKNSLLRLIEAHNSLAFKIDQELNALKELNLMQDYYKQTDMTAKLQSINAYFNQLKLLYDNFNEKNFESYIYISERINSTNNLFSELKARYAADKEQEKRLGIENIRNLLQQINYFERYGSTKNLSNETESIKLTAFDFNKTITPCTELPLFIEQLRLLENKTTFTINNITYFVANTSEYLENASFNQTIPKANIYLNTFCKKAEQKELNETADRLDIPRQELFLITNATPAVLLPSISFILSENEPRCCTFGECKACCTFESCDDERTYPIIFLHGHSFNKKLSPETSIAAFAKMQQRLQEEGIINAGEITLASSRDETAFGEYGRAGIPVSLRATYYYISFFDLGRYHITTQKSEKIENYALRLKELIELVKYRTGAKKVNIVAHSMGGLVAREYIALFGKNDDNVERNSNNNDDINKLILIGTPNSGIRSKAQKYCSFLGSDKECEDMAADSIFLKRLNDKNTNKKTDNIYTIAGTGCKMDSGEGDGIVYLEDAKLVNSENAKNFVVEGDCKDSLGVELHNNLLDPELYPKVYEVVKQVLKE